MSMSSVFEPYFEPHLSTIEETNTPSVSATTTISAASSSSTVVTNVVDRGMFDGVFTSMYGDVIFVTVLVLLVGFAIYYFVMQYRNRNPADDKRATTQQLYAHYRGRVRN